MDRNRQSRDSAECLYPRIRSMIKKQFELDLAQDLRSNKVSRWLENEMQRLDGLRRPAWECCNRKVHGANEGEPWARSGRRGTSSKRIVLWTKLTPAHQNVCPFTNTSVASAVTNLTLC